MCRFVRFFLACASKLAPIPSRVCASASVLTPANFNTAPSTNVETVQH